MTDSVPKTNAVEPGDDVELDDEQGAPPGESEGDDAAEADVTSASVEPEADAGAPDEIGTQGVGGATAEAEGDPAAPETGAKGTDTVALREEFAELNDRHLRLAAEFNNYRRRSESERLEAWSRAQADLVAKFLDVLDDLHRVAQLDLGNATVEAILEGVDLVERKFVRVLEDSGVEILDPERGTAFDPERMEAMMRVPAEAEEEDETVAQVFMKGYSLKGILVRPARVSVFKHG